MIDIDLMALVLVLLRGWKIIALDHGDIGAFTRAFVYPLCESHL